MKFYFLFFNIVFGKVRMHFNPMKQTIDSGNLLIDNHNKTSFINTSVFIKVSLGNNWSFFGQFCFIRFYSALKFAQSVKHGHVGRGVFTNGRLKPGDEVLNARAADIITPEVSMQVQFA